MKKNKIFLTLALLLASISFAIPRDPCDKKEVCCEEPEPGPFAFYYPKDMNLSCPENFFVKGEFLLVQIKEEGLEYAMTQNTLYSEFIPEGTFFPLTGGDIQGYSTGHHNWDWTCGVRVGMGFYLNYNVCNIEADWTYIRINNDSGKNASDGVLLPFWFPPSIQVQQWEDGNASSARWTGNLNTLDLKLGKPYHISRYVIFNPHIGLRAAWINQDYTSRNAGSFYIFGSVLRDYNVVMKAKNDFWGIGLRTGIDTEWHFADSWYLFGNMAASILYSHFDVYEELQFYENIYYQIKHDFYTNSPNMEITLGLCWCHLFSKNRYMVSLKAAYEMHYWWEQNRLRRFFDKDVDAQIVTRTSIAASSPNDEVARGDLSVNGFSFAIQFDF